MIIFKSDDTEKWNDLMLSDTCGTKMMRINPRTGKEELSYELNRRPAELLEEIDSTEMEMFEEVYQIQETFSKMEDVYDVLTRKYNWSKIETQNLLHYLHLSLPKNDKNRSIQLSAWKKWRDKDTIIEGFLNSPRESCTPSEIHYLSKSIMRGGKLYLPAILNEANSFIEYRMKLNLPDPNSDK